MYAAARHSACSHATQPRSSSGTNTQSASSTHLLRHLLYPSIDALYVQHADLAAANCTLMATGAEQKEAEEGDVKPSIALAPPQPLWRHAVLMAAPTRPKGYRICCALICALPDIPVPVPVLDPCAALCPARLTIGGNAALHITDSACTARYNKSVVNSFRSGSASPRSCRPPVSPYTRA